MKKGIDKRKLITAAGAAKDIALVNLLKRIRAGEKLAAHEMDLLKEYEEKIESKGQESKDKDNKQETRGRRLNDAGRVFSNLLEIIEYLDAEGWKISKSSIYNHAKEGKIRPDIGKNYSMKAVINYARTHLTTKNTRQKTRSEELQRDKTLAEIERIKEATLVDKIKRLRSEGELIEKNQVYLELAGRAAVLETDLKGMIQMRAGEFVAMVDGDEKKIGNLVRELLAEVDRVLNDFATTKEFQVIFEMGKEIEN
jgi:hypothetical protein